MATTKKYEVIASSIPIRSKPNLWDKIIGTAYEGMNIDVINIDDCWAYFKYNGKDAYILTYYLKLVRFPEEIGTLTIEYMDIDTNKPIAKAKTYTNLKLISYICTAPSISGYLLYGDRTKSITLTHDKPNKTIIFWYESILGFSDIKNDRKSFSNCKCRCKYPISKYAQKRSVGNVTIKYLDISTCDEIIPSKTLNNLSLDNYTYIGREIPNYEIVEPSTKTIVLNKCHPNETIIFFYRKINTCKKINTYGEVTIKYIDVDTKEEILMQDFYTRLPLGEHTFSAKLPYDYDLIGERNEVIFLTNNCPHITIVFEYKKVYSPVTVKYPYKHTSFEDKYKYEYECEYEKNKFKNQTYLIDLDKFKIYNDNTNAYSTTKGINDALRYAKYMNYDIVKLPEGHYAIDTSITDSTTLTDGVSRLTHNRSGIILPSNMELILDGVILQMIPARDFDYSILTISNCSNSKITGGIILADISFDDNRYYYDRFTNDLGCAICVTYSDNIELNGLSIVNCSGDCIQASSTPLNLPVNNLNIINCNLEYSIGEGVSFNAPGENNLVEGCKIIQLIDDDF